MLRLSFDNHFSIEVKRTTLQLTFSNVDMDLGERFKFTNYRKHRDLSSGGAWGVPNLHNHWQLIIKVLWFRLLIYRNERSHQVWFDSMRRCCIELGNHPHVSEEDAGKYKDMTAQEVYESLGEGKSNA